MSDLLGNFRAIEYHNNSKQVVKGFLINGCKKRVSIFFASTG